MVIFVIVIMVCLFLTYIVHIFCCTFVFVFILFVGVFCLLSPSVFAEFTSVVVFFKVFVASIIACSVLCHRAFVCVASFLACGHADVQGSDFLNWCHDMLYSSNR